VRMLLLTVVASLIAGAMSNARAEVIIDFEDLTLPPNSYYNGNSQTGSNTTGWTSGGVFFGNSYNADWNFWSGWAYSNVNDTTTGDFTNQYAAITGTGIGGTGNYAIAYAGSRAYFDLPDGFLARSAMVTNTTYAALDMANGSMFSKEFTTDDFFRAIFTGYSDVAGMGTPTGQTTVSLADFANFSTNDNPFDYILTDWLQVDLTPLGSARSVAVSFASSDVGDWGINTPAYLAMDDLTLTAVPEPSSFAILATACFGCWSYRRRGSRTKGAKAATAKA
jgi:hypothetical protein